MAQWSQEVSGPATITLNLTNVKQSKSLRSIAQVLREQVRGVQDVRQLSFKNKSAELEVELKGSAQDLADELETKTFPGFAVDVQEVTANSVTAALK
jgi:cell division protein FtsX